MSLALDLLEREGAKVFGHNQKECFNNLDIFWWIKVNINKNVLNESNTHDQVTFFHL